MNLPPTPAFLAERARYQLRHTCEDCAHFVPREGVCAHGYPNALHLRRAFLGVPLVGIFCKEFELA
ncbi:MAG: hypothetical protein HY909_02710 [Deltaproteobacteria bacterium]|nr:hypothetical protein [Deltaproteobacteria bacterium]